MRKLLIIVYGILLASCPDESNTGRQYFFLHEYPELEFRDNFGRHTSPINYIFPYNQNSTLVFDIRDTSLTLYKKGSEERYNGYIRTYYRNIYNVEAVFEEGKIRRLRYWHPNRQLGMDRDFRTQTGQAWTLNGSLSISWAPGETQLRNTVTNAIKQLITDTMTTYFNPEGVMTGYAVRNDTATIRYYADGTPQFLFPLERDGVVKRWHPNGQLQAEGRYISGEEAGTWTEYDSLGNVIGSIVY